MNKEKVYNVIQNNPIIPIYYHDDINDCKRILEICYKSGFRVFEFVNRGEKAFENLVELLSFRDQYFPDMVVGIGTIKKVSDYKLYEGVSVDFLVSPYWNDELSEISKKCDKLWIPGCLTPSEVSNVILEGLKLIKIFPGNIITPSYIISLKQVFPDVEFIVTGGLSVNKDVVKSWKDSGVFGLGFGGKLFSEDNEVIEMNCKKLLSYWA